jgi:hypothetical protein
VLEERIGAGHLYKRGLSDPYFLTSFPKMTAVSFVAHFGWMSVPIWMPAALLAAGLLLLGVASSCTAFRGNNRLVLAFLGTAVLGNVAGHVFYNLSFTQPQGRYMFPTIAAIALLCAYGYRGLTARLSVGLRVAIGALAALATMGFDVYCLLVNVRFYTA